jgi:hypothetical protein
MKKSLVVLSILSLSLMATEAPTKPDPVVKEGVKYIKMLGKALKAEVKKRMKEDPTGAKAAEFCANNASKIAKEVAKNFPEGVIVRRTALKYRNPDNKPDEIDTKVMNKLLEAKKAGKFKAKPFVVDAGNKVRVYKPLLIDDVCLKCHGNLDKIDPKVKETIAKKYPNDKATGFKLYDLRGVIVAELPKKANKSQEDNKSK